MRVRRAGREDLDAADLIYGRIHDGEERGLTEIGWKRSVYPTRETAEAALRRGELFVAEADGAVVGTAIINRVQPESYRRGKWKFPEEDGGAMVLHTLAIDPEKAGQGFGRDFVRFFEGLAAEESCRTLRMDTNVRNKRARRLYEGLGYEEAGVVECSFEGLEGVRLVLLEKSLS